MKKSLFLLLFLALVLALCACGQLRPASPEEIGRQFLEQLLGDNPELRRALLDERRAVAAQNGVLSTEEQQERTDNLQELLEKLYAGLASPELISRQNARDYLTYWQQYIADCGAETTVADCHFTEDGDKLRFEATMSCANGEEQCQLPLSGSLGFDEEGLIDSFTLDPEQGGFTQWLLEQEPVVLWEIMEQNEQQSQD